MAGRCGAGLRPAILSNWGTKKGRPGGAPHRCGTKTKWHWAQACSTQTCGFHDLSWPAGPYWQVGDLSYSGVRKTASPSGESRAQRPYAPSAVPNGKLSRWKPDSITAGIRDHGLSSTNPIPTMRLGTDRITARKSTPRAITTNKGPGTASVSMECNQGVALKAATPPMTV